MRTFHVRRHSVYNLIILVNAGPMSSIEALILQPLDLFPPLPTVTSIVSSQRAG